MIEPRKLAHIVLNVRDVQKAKAFYTRTLGLVVEENTNHSRHRL